MIATVMNDDFRPITRKRRRKGKQKINESFDSKLARMDSELNCDNWLKDFNGESMCPSSTLGTNKGTGVLHSYSDDRQINEILCLGLGSPSNSLSARAQLVLLRYLQQKFHIESQRVQLFDPVFDEEDVTGLTELGFQVLTEASSDCYTSPIPRVLFLPHCELWLYESVLRANWTPESLPTLFMIANRFDTYAENKFSNEMRDRYTCVERLTPFLRCLPIPFNSVHETAFIELAVQFIDPTEHALPPRGGDFWILPPPSIQSKIES